MQRQVNFRIQRVIHYASGFDSGGARGDKGLRDNRGKGESMWASSGKYSFVERKTRSDGVVTKGSTAIFSTDWTIVRTEILSGTARRIGLGLGLGLSERDKSGAFIPTKTRTNGNRRVMKRLQRLYFTTILIAATYQTLWFNTRCNCPAPSWKAALPTP